jgi:hypothetical protein
VIFYVLLPLLLLGRLQRRDFMVFVIFLVSTYGIVNRFIPAALEMVKTRGSPYHQLKTSLTVMTHYNYFSEDRKRDIAIIENATGLSWEKINELFPARWFTLWDASLIQKKQFGSDQGNTEEYNGAFVRRLISENLPIVMGNRLYEFLHSAGVDASTSDARNGFYENPLQLSGSALHPPGLYRFGIAVESKPKSDTLHDWLGRYATTSFAGLLSSQVIVWNTVVFLGLFLAVIFFEGGLSAIGLFTLPSLASAFAIGLVGAGESWRYLYYVYLTGIFVIPLYISYRKDKMVAGSGCPKQQGAR